MIHVTINNDVRNWVPARRAQCPMPDDHCACASGGEWRCGWRETRKQIIENARVITIDEINSDIVGYCVLHCAALRVGWSCSEHWVIGAFHIIYQFCFFLPSARSAYSSVAALLTSTSSSECIVRNGENLIRILFPKWKSKFFASINILSLLWIRVEVIVFQRIWLSMWNGSTPSSHSKLVQILKCRHLHIRGSITIGWQTAEDGDDDGWSKMVITSFETISLHYFCFINMMMNAAMEWRERQRNGKRKKRNVTHYSTALNCIIVPWRCIRTIDIFKWYNLHFPLRWVRRAAAREQEKDEKKKQIRRRYDMVMRELLGCCCYDAICKLDVCGRVCVSVWIEKGDRHSIRIFQNGKKLK